MKLKHIIIGVVLVLLVAGVASAATYLAFTRTMLPASLQKVAQDGAQVSPATSAATQVPDTTIIETPTPVSRTEMVAYSKNSQVVLRNMETNEEIHTKIPIAWATPTATWCQYFDWSADGTKVMALNLKKLFDVEAGTLSTIPLKDGQLQVAQWSPTQNAIYYTPTGKVGTWLFDLESEETTEVSPYSLFTENFTHPISPDGTKAVVVKPTKKKDGYGNPVVEYVIVELANGAETVITPPDDVSTKSSLLEDIYWAPNGAFVAFVYQLDTGDMYMAHRTIALFDLTSKKATKLSIPFKSSRNPVISPDSKSVMFENEEGPQELWKMQLDGTGLMKLAEKPVDFYMRPQFSRDGSRVVYTKMGEGVVIVTSNGSEQEVLDSKAECALWRP